MSFPENLSDLHAARLRGGKLARRAKQTGAAPPPRRQIAAEMARPDDAARHARWVTSRSGMGVPDCFDQAAQLEAERIKRQIQSTEQAWRARLDAEIAELEDQPHSGTEF